MRREHTRATIRHFLAIPTRWMDNDTYGHVNNVTYYSYFDTVVNEHLIREGGLDIRGGDVVGLVVETCCRFTKPLSFPDASTPGCASRSSARSSVVLRDRLFRAGRRRARRDRPLRARVGRSRDAAPAARARRDPRRTRRHCRCLNPVGVPPASQPGGRPPLPRNLAHAPISEDLPSRRRARRRRFLRRRPGRRHDPDARLLPPSGARLFSRLVRRQDAGLHAAVGTADEHLRAAARAARPSPGASPPRPRATSPTTSGRAPTTSST